MQQESKFSKGQMSVGRDSVYWMSQDYLIINMVGHTLIGYCLCKYQQNILHDSKVELHQENLQVFSRNFYLEQQI